MSNCKRCGHPIKADEREEPWKFHTTCDEFQVQDFRSLTDEEQRLFKRTIISQLEQEHKGGFAAWCAERNLNEAAIRTSAAPTINGAENENV